MESYPQSQFLCNLHLQHTPHQDAFITHGLLYILKRCDCEIPSPQMPNAEQLRRFEVIVIDSLLTLTEQLRDHCVLVAHIPCSLLSVWLFLWTSCEAMSWAEHTAYILDAFCLCSVRYLDAVNSNCVNKFFSTLPAINIMKQFRMLYSIEGLYTIE